MMAVVLMYTVRGTFETHHNHLGGSHILATVDHVGDIHCLRRWLVVSSVSWGPESVDKTVEHIQMAAMEAVNHAHAADDIDWFLSQIHCLCQWQFVNYSPMILNHLTSFLNAPPANGRSDIRRIRWRSVLRHVLCTQTVVYNYTCKKCDGINPSRVQYIACSSDLWCNESFDIFHFVVMICGVSPHL
jgi:hypothetical protein